MHQAGQGVIGVPPGGRPGGTPCSNRASTSSRQARSARPRPRLRSAPRTTVGSSSVGEKMSHLVPRGRPRPATCSRRDRGDPDARSPGGSVGPAMVVAAPTATRRWSTSGSSIAVRRPERQRGEDRVPRSLRSAPFRIDGTYRRFQPRRRATSTMSCSAVTGSPAPAGRSRWSARAPCRPAGMPPGSAARAADRPGTPSAPARSRSTSSSSRPRPIQTFQLTTAKLVAEAARLGLGGRREIEGDGARPRSAASPPGEPRVRLRALSLRRERRPGRKPRQ